jgi:phosphatidylinositol-3-phosphatase
MKAGRRRRVWGSLLALGVTLGALTALFAGNDPQGAGAAEVPRIKHLFVIVMENENADNTFSATPPAPYLGTTMRSEGAFLPNYYGIGHESLDNYLALISGQPPNVQTQSDCAFYNDMHSTSTAANGVAIGQGCVFPSSVKTIANQLEAAGHTWRSYNQDMAAGAAAGESTTCRHPALNELDWTQKATKTNQYAARHDPFVYFHALIDSPTCDENVVDLTRLPQDLQNLSTSPEYAFITPDLCYDGHDQTCADETSPAGFAGVNAFLEEWVPRIKASAAYQDHGAIMVTFDESEDGAESCCGEHSGPNTPNNGAFTLGDGGGRIGAVIESPCIKPGTVSEQDYNHYSALRWMEDDFDLPHLAEAAAEGLRPFGADVFTEPACGAGSTSSGASDSDTDSGGGGGGPPGGGSGGGKPGTGEVPALRLKVWPRRVPVDSSRIFHFRLQSDSSSCRAGTLIRFAGHRLHANGRGRAQVKLKLPRPGKWIAKAHSAACGPAESTVRAHS